MSLVEVWLGLAVIIGITGLAASSFVRWHTGSMARLAAFGASFGLIALGLGDLVGGDWWDAALRMIVASAELYILGKALQHRVRRAP